MLVEEGSTDKNMPPLPMNCFVGRYNTRNREVLCMERVGRISTVRFRISATAAWQMLLCTMVQLRRNFTGEILHGPGSMMPHEPQLQLKAWLFLYADGKIRAAPKQNK